MEQARRAYEQAHEAFNSVTSDIPSGLPQPDGTDRIRNAGQVYRSTMNHYSEALREFNTFISGGAVPDHLKKEKKKPQAED